MNCYIGELGPSCINLGNQKELFENKDELLEKLKKVKIFVGAFEMGLVAELQFSEINEKGNLIYKWQENEISCGGYIYWGGCEIVFVMDDEIYIRKKFDDTCELCCKKNKSIIHKSKISGSNFGECYFNHSFPGFDEVDIDYIELSIDWISNLSNYDGILSIHNMGRMYI